MLIVCPSCATSYEIDPATLQADGRRVRCVRCRHVWHAEVPAAQKLLAAAEAIAPPHRPIEQALEAFAAEMAPPAAEIVEPAAAETTPVDQGLEPPSEEGAGGSAADEGVPAGEPDAAVEIDAPPIAPVDLDDGQPAAAAAAAPAEETPAELPEDIETYAARRAKREAGRQTWRWPLSQMQSGVLALLLIDAILISWRNDVVRLMPQTASFYSMLGLSVNVRGLAFTDVGTVTEQHEGVPVLVVEGNLVNDSRKIADVPRLKFSVRNTAGEEVYSWTAAPPRPSLPPGDAVSFRSRLASPPPDGRDVLVRFVTRNDVIPEGR